MKPHRIPARTCGVITPWRKPGDHRWDRRFRLSIFFACALLLTACSSPKKEFFVAFSQCNNAEPYRAAQNALMTKLFADAGGVKLVIADAQQDNSKQVAQVETFIRQKPDLLIVAPNERAALTAVMGQAMEAHIPVICLERDILQPNYTTYIHSDNTAIGRLAGQFIVDVLTKKYGAPKGNVVQMRGLLGVEGEIKRDSGAKEILAKYPEIHIVAEPVADWIQATIPWPWARIWPRKSWAANSKSPSSASTDCRATRAA